MENFVLNLESAYYELDQYDRPIFHMIINGHNAYVTLDHDRFFYEYHVVPLDSFEDEWDWSDILPGIHIKTIGGITGGKVETDVAGCTDDEKIYALTDQFFKDASKRNYEPQIIDIN